MEAPAASSSRQASIAATANSPLDPGELFGGIDFSKRNRVIVAVSGGSDSLALLLLLKRYIDTGGHKALPLAVTVDHRLRPESADEARRVGEIAARAGVEHRIVAWEMPKPATGIAAAAREARHSLLAGAAREAGTDIVLTGHTMDDQAETVAMRGLRGEGRGAAGIAPATLFDGRCWFVRPLLRARRAALRRFLTGVGQDWMDDPSNSDRRFERARTRTELADGEVENLAAEAAAAGALREALGRRAAALIRAHAGLAAPGLVRLDKGFTAADDSEAAIYALRILLAAIGGREHLPDAEKTAALLAGLAHPPFRATLSRSVADARRAGIFLYREWRGLPQPRPFAVGIWDGRFRLEGSGIGQIVAPSGPETAAAEATKTDIPASLARAAHATRPALPRLGRFSGLLDEAEGSAQRAVPIVAPWARYLPSFDIEPARAAAELLGAAEIPPPPLAEHNRPEA